MKLGVASSPGPGTFLCTVSLDIKLLPRWGWKSRCSTTFVRLLMRIFLVICMESFPLFDVQMSNGFKHCLIITYETKYTCHRNTRAHNLHRIRLLLCLDCRRFVLELFINVYWKA